MSLLLIEIDIFKWLQSIQIIKEGKRNSENKIQLSQTVTGKFFDGLYISKILKKIIENQSEINQNLLTKMKSIKQNSTPAIRLYNWNLIADVLKYYKYSLDYVQKSKILNLQSQPIRKILTYLKDIYRNQNINRQEDATTLHNSVSNNSLKEIQFQSKSLHADIKNIPGKKSTEATNIMQFLVISLSKQFKLSPQHTLNLFLDNNKYLAHLLVKGIKDSFQPILMFQNQILSNLSFIVLTLFSANEEKSIQFFFQAIKPCLISKDLQVTLKCLQIFNKIHLTYTQNNLDRTSVLNWFRREGVNTLLFSSKRHQQTLQQALHISHSFVENQLFQFIRPSQKSPLWSNQTEKLHFYNLFLFVAQNNILNQFENSTCLTEWTNYCLKSLKKNKNIKDMKYLIKILHRKWIQFPNIFQGENNLAQNFISFLKGSSFSNDFMLFIDSIKIMFDLMEVLGKLKNKFAPIFYKTLVNCLSFQSSQERVVFIVQNFISVFKLIDNLPGSLIVQPLVKSIQRNCTVSSLNLCKLLIVHKKTKQQQRTQIIDVFTKIFFEDPYQGSLAIQYIFQCLPFLEQQTKNQFLIKNSQLCLAHFYSLSKSIKRNFQDLIQTFKRYENQSAMKQGQNAYLNQVKKYLLIQNLMKFLSQIIENQDEQTISALEQPIFMTYLKVTIELQKPNIAQILKNIIMKKYYDVPEQLAAVTDKYEKKYQLYIQNSKRKGVSNNQSQDQSPNKDNQANHSSLYASKSLVLEDSPQQNSKTIKLDAFKPEKSALKDLQLIKSRMIKMKMITQQNQKKKDLIQQKKQLIRSVLNERRLVRYGVKSQPDIDYKCSFEFDSVKIDKIINGLPNIEIINLEKQQEDIYVVDVDSLMKKYRKVWRFLFFKYSTFGAKSNDQKIQEKINIAQVWKMHRQYKTDFIKKQQSFAIIRIINENMKRKNDLQNLTYLGFEEYVVQFCILAYNKIGLTSLSPGQKVAKLINQFKMITEQKGGNIDMFSNPEEVYAQDTQVIKEFNRRLFQNSNYILPQGYKKVKQLEYLYQYEFTQPIKTSFQHSNKKFSFSSAYFEVLEVLDSIFSQNQKLGFHIVEPKTQKIQKTLAKPALFQQINQKMKNYKGGYLMPKRQINSTYIASREKVNLVKPQFHPLIQFSLGVKLGLAAVPLKYKYIGQQVAYWVDDMLDAIQNGSLIVGNKSHKKIQNQAIKKKRIMVFKVKQQVKQKQKYYKQRSQSVRSQFEKIQVIKKEKSKSRIQEIKSKRQKQKQKQQKLMKKKMQQFQKAKQYFSEKHEKDKQVNNKQQIRKKFQKQQYKKNVEEYFKKKKQQLQERQMNLKKDKQYEKTREIEEKQKKKQFQKKVYFSVLKKDQQVLEKIQIFKDKYLDFSNQSFVQQQFQIHKKSLSILFQLLIKHQKSKISATDKNEISQSTFNFFTLKFKIVPFILQKTVLSKIFLSIGREQSNKAGFGISYRGFQEALLKIIVKSKKMLNDLAQKRRKKQVDKLSGSITQNKNQDDQNQFEEANLKNVLNSSKLTTNKNIFNQNLAEDYLFDPESVTQQTIRQFMLFLNLPDDKLGIEQRYREVSQAKHTKATSILRKQLKQEIISL